jgi:hypothetical protein
LNRFIDSQAHPPGNASEPQPPSDVTASLQVCPQNAALEGVTASEPGALFTADNFEALKGSKVHLEFGGTQATTNDVEPNQHAVNADPVANQVNLTANGGIYCEVEATPAGAGVATYDSAPLASQATMIGATRVSIDYTATAANIQLDARLYDVFPSDSSVPCPSAPAPSCAVLVDRGIRRVTSASGTVTYELHGNGWRFPAGHRIRIEIAQDDDPYAKASTTPSSAILSGVRLDIPVREPSYPVPTVASPLRVSLVPHYKECTSGNANATHAGPLPDTAACSPPELEATQVRLGSSNTNGRRVGLARLDVCTSTGGTGPGSNCEELDGKLSIGADVRLRGNSSDIVCSPGSDAGPCPAGPGSDFDPNFTPSPYRCGINPGTNSNKQFPSVTAVSGTCDPLTGGGGAGEPCLPSPPNPPACVAGTDMTATAQIPHSGTSPSFDTGPAVRITDRLNNPSAGEVCYGSASNCAATVVDQPVFAVPVDCVANGDNSIGSYCGVNTTANALLPGLVVPGKEAVVELGQIQVKAPGACGDIFGCPETFAVQGIYVP